MQAQAYRNLIAGQWVDGSDRATFEDRSPAHPEDLLGTFPQASRADACRAIDAAAEAATAWATTPPPKRGAILHRAAELLSAQLEDLAKLLTREEGKTLAEARGEVARTRDIFLYYGGEGWRLSGDVLPSANSGEMIYTRREPLGVVAVITPWNFPAAIPAWKIAPALAYGNTVVFKPASLTPLVGLRLVEALVGAGLPPGVMNFVTGAGSVVGDELSRNPRVSGVSFTGSYSVGSSVYVAATEGMKRAQCEMGGKNPLVVLDDADLGLAVELAVRGGFGLTGQSCTATSRVIALPGIADEFVHALSDAARNLRIGDGLDAATQMGPAVSPEQMETDLKYMRIGQEEGARLLAGGGQPQGPGYHIEPTVFDGVEPGMRIAQEEIFGPVISVIRAKDFDDSVRIANGVQYGLSASVVTRDLRHALAFAEQIDAGIVKINGTTTDVALQAPFGGFKHSSAGTFREQGQAAKEFYTRSKTVYMRYG